uniref:Uncharacterized protein n=1 Tax=Setaria viridis TaxID=4556 RepID=A0A4U6VL12_SETVI|nr:hypothetical protein SEVIR_3G309000v2 [Setaria viridis]
MPTPAPAPAADCSLNCSMQCGPQCEVNRTAGLAKCDTDYVPNWNGCYDSCTSCVCPHKSACANSGCVFGNCACDHTNASSCCQWCGQALLKTYFNCRNFEDRYVPYCINNCTNDSNKNCTPG